MKKLLYHLLIGLLIVTSNVIVLWRISNLDLFDFFSTLYNLINISFVSYIVLSLFFLILLYFKFDRFKSYEKIKEVETKAARHELLDAIKNLAGETELIGNKVRNLEVVINNDLINNKDLKEKLKIAIENLPYKYRFSEKNAFFSSFAHKISDVIADTYTKMKTQNLILDYEVKIKLKKQFKDLLISEGINLTRYEPTLNMVEALLNDFNQQRANQKKSKDIIVGSTRILLTDIYYQYISTTENDIHEMHENKTIDEIANELINEYRKQLILTSDPREIARIQTELERLEKK